MDVVWSTETLQMKQCEDTQQRLQCFTMKDKGQNHGDDKSKDDYYA